VARLNLTIPDSLYERLQRLRDRVNVSKVCAIALEKELAMLEGSLTTVDPKVQRLITRLQRIQSVRERWYQRGREDGEAWAIEVAGEVELRRVDEEWEAVDWEAIEQEGSDEGDLPDLPSSFRLREALQKWVEEDRETGADEWAPPAGTHAGRERREHSGRPAVDRVHRMAYLRGWHTAVREIWQMAAPMLERSAGR
jgi:hypothetical protein